MPFLPPNQQRQSTEGKCYSYASTDEILFIIIQHSRKNHARFIHLSHTHTHTRLMALFPGLPGWTSTRKVKPIWILLKQETVSGSGISWATCKSAPRSRQITMPAPHHSVFYRPDALPAAQPTVSEHWRHFIHLSVKFYCNNSHKIKTKDIIWCFMFR